MDINKELDEIFNDPLLNISDKEKELFAIPTDMMHRKRNVKTLRFLKRALKIFIKNCKAANEL